MANITFTIGSVFKGEGFKKCQAGIQELNKHVASAAGITSQMAGAMSGMNSQAAAAAQSVAGLLAAFASGNPILVGVQVGMIALSKVVQTLNDAEAKAKEEADKLNEALKRLGETQRKIQSDKMTEYISAIRDEARRLGAEFEMITRNAQAFSDILNKIDKSKDSGKLLQMQIDKFNASSGAGENKAIVEAEWNVKIQLEKNAQALKEHEQAIEKAKDEIQINTDRQRNIRERVAVVDEAIMKLKIEEETTSGNELEKRKEIQSKINELENEKVTLTEEFAKTMTQEQELKQKVILAEQERENQILENTLASKQADQALINAKNAKSQALKKSASTIQTDTQAQAEADAKLLQAKLDAAQKEAGQAGQNFDAAIDNFNNARNTFRGDNMNLINQILRNTDFSKMPNTNLQNGDVFIPNENGVIEKMKYQEAAAQAAVDKGIADGSIRNMKDLKNAEKAAARAARDAASSQEANQARRDARELERLEKMNPKAMSEADKKKLEQLQKLRDAKNKDEKEAEEALNNAKEAEKKKQEADQAVIEIKQILEEKLGLK